MMFTSIERVLEILKRKQIGIEITNSQNSEIKNNIIAENVYIYGASPVLSACAEDGPEMSRRYHDLYEEERVVHSSEDRLLLLNEKYEILFKLFKDDVSKPQIRFHGMYSGLSTHWSLYDNRDICVLEREEQKSIIRLVKSGFPIRMILSLNIKDVLDFGFSLNDIIMRIDNMCEMCTELQQYANFQFVIEEEKSLTSTTSIDDKVLMYQYNFKNAETYNSSFWTSDYSKISAFNKEFDIQFRNLYQMYSMMRKIINIRDYCDYIHLVLSRRIDNYNRLYLKD